MNATNYQMLTWKAAQGSKSANRKLSQHHAAQGNQELAKWYEYKANGGTAFSPEAIEYKAQ